VSELDDQAESHSERLNRELIELLNGLRVILPGVQVLFAFLLAVPFSARFSDITQLQQDVFFAAFLCAAVSSALLIAPSSYHRLRWRQRDKEQLLRTSNRLAIAGTFFLAAAMACSVFVITDLLFELVSALVGTVLVALLFVWLWFGLPLSRRFDEENF
jgi:Ca2+/Na+ antiporter